MVKRNVIVELRHTEGLERSALSTMADPTANADMRVLPKLASVELDPTFPPIMLPNLAQGDFPKDELYDTNAGLRLSIEANSSTYLVRGTVEDDAIESLDAEIQDSNTIVNIYSDIAIEPMIVCPSSPPVGDDNDVERLLCTSTMHKRGMDGSGVLVAIVDTGVNMAYLNSHGKHPKFDVARSWAWDPAVVTPGSAPVDHGTMCAFDVCIAAPKCTILDIALLHPISTPPGGTLMSGFLSDAIRAYRHLLNVMMELRRPGENRSLVVNNSWGMFHPSWDFEVGHPGNYSDNPNHPFNVIVASLERAGADILFAAGNCGKDCPDGRCQNVTTRTIYGANSSPSVISVAGIDTTRARVGYSAIGPGRLTPKKPDICGYTHFSGSGVYSADGGTSAACPVVSGVVAAIRSRRPFDPTNSITRPSAIRSVLTSTAIDLGPSGYDFAYGYGAINGCKIANLIAPPIVVDRCKLFPWLCYPINICDRYPWLCDRFPIVPPIIPPIIPPIPKPYPIPPGPQPDPVIRRPSLSATNSDIVNDFITQVEASQIDSEEFAYVMGYINALSATVEKPKSPQKKRVKGCGCDDC